MFQSQASCYPNGGKVVKHGYHPVLGHVRCSLTPRRRSLRRTFYVGGGRSYPPQNAISIVEEDSAEAFELGPGFFERYLRVPEDVDRQVLLVGHAVLAGDGVRVLDVVEHRFEPFAGDTDGDDDLARTTPRSPDVVVIVTADDPREEVFRAEEIEGPGLPEVTGEDAASCLLRRREVAIDPGNGLYHVFPTLPVGEGLRDLRRSEGFRIYTGVALDGAGDLGEGVHGQHRHHRQRCD